ncbi:nitroreductase family protein [Lusitaniella coriacea LEGE 07157]|uniref:Nitroreductase family protein n=1 Tax=Lusitaniella coriacea LEGE 07157 TaxID=945747 RepID=A0A8J7JEZ7_9CYAN|nr:nitroreductase family protein [Lusitaniella coriacea]MBE9118470.1 nitroreductase family protein [Lusitaniella coriacea LEGE 07157]
MTDKLAKTQYPIHDLLKRRWSPLSFANRPVSPDTLCTLFEAANWTASCFNEQPWHFIVATQDNSADFERLLSCLVEANQQWAKDAPVLMISVAKLFFERNGNENRHAFHDVGGAATSLALQATAMDLYIHQMAGFDAEKAREVFNIPQGYDAVAAIALGYLADPQQLPENLQQRELAPRSRKPLKQFVFSSNWGQTSPLVGS